MALTHKRDDNPADRMIGDDCRSCDDLIEAHFDRELSSQLQMELDRLLRRDPAMALRFAQMKSASEALREPVGAPDNTDAILAEVGHRRGWIGARLQRFVSIGRLAIAASFLLTIAAALAAKRFAPDAAIFPSEPTPLADVADYAADEANCGVNDFLAAVNSLGASSGIIRVSRSLPAPGSSTINAGLISAGRRMKLPNPARRGASGPFAYTVHMMSLRDVSLRKLTSQQRVGSVVILVGSAPRRANEKNEKDASVTGW